MKRVAYLSTHFAPTILLKFLLTMGVHTPRSSLQCLRAEHSLCSLENDLDRLLLSRILKLSSVFFLNTEVVFNVPPGCVKVKKN